MNRPLSVHFTRRASRQVGEADRWWRENRSKAPEAFQEELIQALDLIASQPGIGARARNVRLAGVRRLLLHRVRYYVYYRVVDMPEPAIQVIALWHSSRGTAPSI